MKQFIVILTAAFALVSCTSSKDPAPAPAPTESPAPTASPTSFACKVEEQITGGVSKVLASTLECSSAAAIQADVQKALGSANVCAPKGAIGDAICTQVTNALASVLLSKIPAAWGCTGGKPVDQLKTIVTDACKKNIGF